MDILGYKRITRSIFPVLIYDLGQELMIEDRRPSYDLIFTILGLFAWAFLTYSIIGGLIADESYFFVAVLCATPLYLIFRLSTRFFRDVYVFDKSKNTYKFFRQSLVKKDLLEGDLRQFRATQVEKAIVTSENTRYEVFRVALLLDGELLLGRSATQCFRENPPLFCNEESEVRIARAIAGFLKVPYAGVASVANFQPPAIGF